MARLHYYYHRLLRRTLQRPVILLHIIRFYLPLTVLPDRERTGRGAEEINKPNERNNSVAQNNQQSGLGNNTFIIIVCEYVITLNRYASTLAAFLNVGDKFILKGV